MTKIAAGVLPVVLLYVLQKTTPLPFETLQLWVAAATLPVAFLFVVLYIPERPWRHWFGTSLLLLAVGVVSYAATVVLFRALGPGYWGRDFMVTSSVGLILTSMVMRTWVLYKAQGRSIRHRH